MTLQYDQGDINLRDASPINITTPDASTVLVNLDQLTADGMSLAVSLYGGGSDPAAPGANNYSVQSADAIFTRTAGVGGVAGSTVIANFTGIAAVLAFLVDDVTIPGVTICQLSITVPAFFTPYTHRLKVSKIRF